MKSLILYAAPGSKSSSARIAKTLKEKLTEPVESLNVFDMDRYEKIGEYSTLIFIVATYGDQELHDNYEDFILNIDHSLPKFNYVVCEIGNYYGYDDFELGAGRIIIKHMENLKGNSLLPLYSIDTLPLLDEQKLDKLVVSLNSILN